MKKVILLSSLFSFVGMIAEETILEKNEKTAYISTMDVTVKFKKRYPNDAQTEKTEAASAKEKAIQDAFNELDEKTKILFALLEDCKNSGDCEVLRGKSHLVRAGKVIETVTVQHVDGWSRFLFGDGKSTEIHMIYPDRIVRNILNPGENRPKSEK